MPSANSVPMLDLGRQYQRIQTEILAAVERVCASTHYILGEEVQQLESEIAGFTGAAAAVGCASGTDALWLALLAAGVQPSDQVVTTPFSFFASASSIVRAGASPVFVDIDPRTFNLDPSAVERTLRRSRTRKRKYLLPVHLYGQCADMDAFTRIAAEFELGIVEDAAQAIGAEWNGKGAGAWGVAGAFSFYPTKNLSAYGDAGCVTASTPVVAEHLRRLRNHGSPKRYVHEELGWNSRIDAIQAAVLRVKMRHIRRWNEQRRQKADIYDRLFASAGLQGPDSPVTVPYREPQAEHIFHQYVIRARRRNELRDFLSAQGIGSEIYYPIPLHLQTCFNYLGSLAGDFPESERAAKEALALPMFPELTEGEQKQVVNVIAEFYS